MPITIIDTLGPYNDGKFPTHEDVHGKGGFQVRDSVADRNSIPTKNRKEGMMVYVKDVNKHYQLRGGTTDDKWVETNASSNIAYTPGGAGVSTNLSVETKLRERVSVKDFGATGDGITDDTASIQACLDYCKLYGKITFFPAGTYIVTPVPNIDAVDPSLNGQNCAALHVSWGMTIEGEPGSIIKLNDIKNTPGYTKIMQRVAYQNFINLYPQYTSLESILFRTTSWPALSATATPGTAQRISYDMWYDIVYWIGNSRVFSTYHSYSEQRFFWADSTNNGGPTSDSPPLMLRGITIDGNLTSQGNVANLNDALSSQALLYCQGSSIGTTNAYGVVPRHRLRVLIDNCTLQNTPGRGITIYASNDVSVDNSAFWDCRSAGVKANNTNSVIRLCNLMCGGQTYNSPLSISTSIVESSRPDGTGFMDVSISNCIFDALKSNPNLGTASILSFLTTGPNRLSVDNTAFNAGIPTQICVGTTSSYATVSNCTFRHISPRYTDFPRPGQLTFNDCDFVLPIISENLTSNAYNTSRPYPHRGMFSIRSFVTTLTSNESNQADYAVNFNNCIFRTDRDPLKDQTAYSISSVTIGSNQSEIGTALITTESDHGFSSAVNIWSSLYRHVFVKLSGFNNPLYNKSYKVTNMSNNTVRILLTELQENDNYSFVPGEAKIQLIPTTLPIIATYMTGSSLSFNNCQFSGFSEALTLDRIRDVTIKNNHFDSFSMLNVSSPGTYTTNSPGYKSVDIDITLSNNTFGKTFSTLGRISIPGVYSSTDQYFPNQSVGKTTLRFINQEIPAHCGIVEIINSTYADRTLFVTGSRVLTSHNKPTSTYKTLPGDAWKMNYADIGKPTSYRASYPNLTTMTSDWSTENQTIKFGTTTERPILGAVDKGTFYADTDLSSLIWWDGTSWKMTQGGVATNVTFGGDLNGNATSQTVVGLQGRSVATTSPSSYNVLLWDVDSNKWTPTRLSQDMILPGISITSFESNQINVEVGSALSNPTFSAVYSKVPTSVNLSYIHSDGNGDNQSVVSVPTVSTQTINSYTPSYNITKSLAGANVKFTLTITDGIGTVSKTLDKLIYWGYKIYTGVGDDWASITNKSSFITSLTSKILPSKIHSFTETAGSGKYFYFAMPSSYGIPTITNSLSTGLGGFTSVDTITLTTAAGANVTYDVYMSNQTGLGTVKWTLT